MSVFSQFKNVSALGSGGGWRQPLAQCLARPTPDTPRSKPHQFFDRASVSALGLWNGSAVFKQTSVALIAAARRFLASMLGQRQHTWRTRYLSTSIPRDCG